MTNASRAPWRFEVVDRIGSTNDALIDRASRGEPGRLGLLARRQDAARGSRGRVWREPAEGNLAFSVLLRPQHPVQTGRLAVFAAALALSDALSRSVSAGWRLVLKWPNDVLLAGGLDPPGKVAGILVETGIAAPASGTDWLVIGFGANLRQKPDLPGARCLAEAGGIEAMPEPVARVLLQRLDHWFGLGQRDGFAPIRAEWLARAHPPGTMLSVDGGGITRSGRFAGLGADGTLLLDTSSGLKRISTGTVLLGVRENA